MQLRHTNQSDNYPGWDSRLGLNLRVSDLHGQCRRSAATANAGAVAGAVQPAAVYPEPQLRTEVSSEQRREGSHHMILHALTAQLLKHLHTIRSTCNTATRACGATKLAKGLFECRPTAVMPLSTEGVPRAMVAIRLGSSSSVDSLRPSCNISRHSAQRPSAAASSRQYTCGLDYSTHTQAITGHCYIHIL